MESLEVGTTSESEYQVFLNFRGPDTRNEFTDFLYHSLTDAGICVFRDDEELRVGERIDEALQRAIDDARIYIPIFSPTYASSKWCLRELMQIMRYTKSNGNKEILPIFFKVEPKDVKMKDGLYHSAILNLERENKASTEQVDSWRKALTEVAAIKGREVKPGDSQAKIIKLLVEDVVVKLKIKQKSVTEHLTGINDRVIEVRNLLDVLSRGVRLIEIYGMGGIGKTTLAKVVFNELSTHFGKCCCFLENVRENSSSADGLVKLQKKLLSEIGNAAKLEGMEDTEQLMKMIEGTLCNKKVLIVLDDVDKNEQVEKLVGKGALYSGTRVLITTRNEDFLQSTGLKHKMLPYEMKVMSSNHALQLFSRHAFENDSPSDDYYDISKEIVYATGSLPLTIEVIGSFLKNKTQGLWKEKLDELHKAPPRGVFEVLKISYDALTFEQQQIFLDIACFFIGEEKTNATYMWKACELFPLTGIEVLINKSLIKIGEGNEFLMHDQLRDLGRGIVRNENPMNPEKRSRLWINNEVLDTLKTKKMKNVEAMKLKFFPREVSIKSEDIRRFEKLRYLRLCGGIFDGDLMDCFPKLRYIDWRRAFCLERELTNTCLKNVVVLKFLGIYDIDDLKLWSLIKEAKKLKVLYLGGNRYITRTPDLSGCSTLERLTFSNCSNLMKIDGSIGKLNRLIDLRFLSCSRLEGLPEEIGGLQNLENFSLEYCCEIKELPNSIYKCKSLRELHLQIGSVELTGDIGKLENLEVLWVDADLKGQLPSEIGLLSRLQKLVIGWMSIVQPFINFTWQIIPDLSNLTNLVELDLFSSDQTRTCVGDLRWIGRLSKLEKLRLHIHVPPPNELASLPRLNQLHLFGLNLHPLMPALLSSNLKHLSNLKLCSFQMQEIQLDGHHLPNLINLDVAHCRTLKRFIISSMRKLKVVGMWACLELDEIHIAGVLESLERLRIGNSRSLRRFVYVDINWEYSHESSLILASRVFNKLRWLCLDFCDMLDIRVVGMSESLEDLLLSGLHLQSVGGLSNLKNLKSLHIFSSPKLRIVEGLDKLKFLNKLDLTNCESLESQIDVSTTELPNDCRLCISQCWKSFWLDSGHFRGTVQGFKRRKEEEIVPVALPHPLMVRFLFRASRAQNVQLQMRVPGKTEELLTPFEYSS